jgi:hypothetical protein
MALHRLGKGISPILHSRTGLVPFSKFPLCDIDFCGIFSVHILARQHIYFLWANQLAPAWLWRDGYDDTHPRAIAN